MTQSMNANDTKTVEGTGQQNAFVDVTIPETSVKNDVIFYHINVKLPYKNYTVTKRFSDFQTLKQHLEILRLNHTLPYQLPSKFTFWASNDKVIEKRKADLSRFLNDLVNDKTLRSNQLILEFLNLPKTIFMTHDINVRDNWLGEKSGRVDVNNWIPQLKAATNSIKNITTKIYNDSMTMTSARTQLLTLKKDIDALSQSLVDDEVNIGEGEARRRTELLSQAKREYYELETLLKDRSSSGPDFSQSSTDKSQLFSSNKRVLGKPRETSKTLPLNNQELYHAQQLQLQQQNQDIDQIRSALQRQRQIATVIHNEVNEQNELIDDLSQQVDDSGDRMRTAKKMLRKIK